MDLKIFLMATIVVCLKMPESHGSLYHSRRHECLPPSVRLYEPIVYNVAGVCICALKCSQKSCLFFEFSDPDVCKIYGLGMESTNVYVNTDFAAPPAGGPLQEMAKGKRSYPEGSMINSSFALDDDHQTYWENGWIQPWWIVDLGAFYFIHFVNILPRLGYFAFRFQEVEVRAGHELREDGDLSQWELIGFYPGIHQGGNVRAQFNSTQGICGRFVSVQRINDLDDTNAISDAEVYVREPKPY